ncbi:hypothetical protein D3C84_763750 [compost metagenome]
MLGCDFGEAVEVDRNDVILLAVVDQRFAGERLQVLVDLPELDHLRRIHDDGGLPFVRHLDNFFTRTGDHGVFQRQHQGEAIDEGEHHAVVLDDSGRAKCA